MHAKNHHSTHHWSWVIHIGWTDHVLFTMDHPSHSGVRGYCPGGAAWNNNARGGGDRTMISLRLPVLRMNTHGGTTNTATSCAHKLRPPGAVKFDKHSIHVIPKDKLTGPNLTGDAYAREVLRRVMFHSRQVVLERVGNGEKKNSTRS